MEISNMKNIVVLKNLPSNLVDEAFVILKQNKKIKKLELIENNKFKTNKEKEKNTNEYVLKEAQMLISYYMDKIDKNNKKEIPNKILKKKYKRLKLYSLVTSISLFISLVINLI